MKIKWKLLSDQIRGWRLLVIFVAAMLLPMRSAAPIIQPPFNISMSLTSANTVTITASNLVESDTEIILQMETDLTATNWASLQTNYVVVAGQSEFDKIPATNNCEYFRVKVIY
jgi:hypothetical protein